MIYKLNKKAFFGIKINYIKLPGRKILPHSKRIDEITREIREINKIIKKEKLTEAKIKEYSRIKNLLENERFTERNRLKTLKRVNIRNS